MYAVLQIAKKQYKATLGDLIKINYLPSKNVGDEFEADGVLLFKSNEGDYKFGFPTLNNAKAVLEVVKHDRDDKVIVFKYKSGKGYKRTRGHKQDFTVAKVKNIEA